jgi:GNAT superfamily N-acetyltransferase
MMPEPLREDVRSMRAGDVAELAALEAAARAAVALQRGGPAHLADVPSVGEWSALLGRADRQVVVGTLDDVVVGYLELALDHEVAMVRQVYVHPEARELGLGDGMLEHAAQLGRAAGCLVIEGTALPGDRDTKNLYERAGIVARKIVVSRRL